MKQKRIAATAIALSFLVVACGSEEGSDTTTAGGGDTPESILNGEIKCDQQYAGKKVTVFSPVRNSENDKPVDDLVAALPALDGRVCVLPLRREAGIKDSEIVVCVGAGDGDDPADRDITRVFSAQGLSVDVLRLPGDLPRTGTGKVAYPELRRIALDA